MIKAHGQTKMHCPINVAENFSSNRMQAFRDVFPFQIFFNLCWKVTFSGSVDKLFVKV